MTNHYMIFPGMLMMIACLIHIYYFILTCYALFIRIQHYMCDTDTRFVRHIHVNCRIALIMSSIMRWSISLNRERVVHVLINIFIWFMTKTLVWWARFFQLGQVRVQTLGLIRISARLGTLDGWMTQKSDVFFLYFRCIL